MPDPHSLPPSEKPPSPRPSGNTRRPRWHLIYFALAVFDILAVAGSLYLNHQIVGIYMDTVAENEKWNHRLVEYSKLWELASEVNAPGNNVFDSLQIDQEKTLRNRKLEDFHQALSVLRKDLNTAAPSTDIEELQQRFDQIHFRMAEMIAESDRIFTLLGTGKDPEAGQRMALMDRKYAALNSHLVALNLKVGEITHQIFEDRAQNALFLRQFEYFFGVVILLMVIGITLYGTMVARRVRAIEEEKEIYLAELEEKNTELSNFASIASHDMKEPLRKIISFGDRLKNSLPDSNHPGHPYLQRMLNAALRMSGLIDSLLALTRVHKETQSAQLTDLNQVIQEVIENLEIRFQDTGGTIQIDPLPVLHAHPIQIQQLFQNLISNALKFKHEDLPPKIRVRYSSQPLEHVIVIEDNGIGFDTNHSQRIFNIFERLHGKSEFEGHGIGLSICQKIASLHKGSIEAQSRKGEGASFTITLPKQTTES